FSSRRRHTRSKRDWSSDVCSSDLSCHLEHFSKFKRALLKRLTFPKLLTLELLLYIDECTSAPRYDDISNLLTSGFLVAGGREDRSEEHTSELQSRFDLVCRLLLEK